jgi:hypothetical protein
MSRPPPSRVQSNQNTGKTKQIKKSETVNCLPPPLPLQLPLPHSPTFQIIQVKEFLTNPRKGNRLSFCSCSMYLKFFSFSLSPFPSKRELDDHTRPPRDRQISQVHNVSKRFSKPNFGAPLEVRLIWKLIFYHFPGAIWKETSLNILS